MYVSFAWIAAVREDPLGHWTTSAEVAVLIAVFSALDNHTGTGWASRKALALKARTHPSTVSRLLAKAERLGWIRVKRERRRANSFSVCVREAVLALLPGAVRNAFASGTRVDDVPHATRSVTPGAPFSTRDSKRGRPSLRTESPPRQLSGGLDARPSPPRPDDRSRLDLGHEARGLWARWRPERYCGTGWPQSGLEVAILGTMHGSAAAGRTRRPQGLAKARHGQNRRSE